MDTPHILLCYKNFSKDTSVSHIGLGVTCSYTAKTLRAHGYDAQALPIFGADDLTEFIKAQDRTSKPVTHVVICAQWIPIKFLAQLARAFPFKKFAQNCHSNIGFLQAEPPAINLVRQAIDLEQGLPNFLCSSNNLRLTQALQGMYGHPVTYLPNLYYFHGEEPIHRPGWSGGHLKIGCFGSLRVYKNFSTAIAASVLLINELKVHGEIWINKGRTDGAGDVVYRTAKAWTDGLPHVTLKEFPWASWPEFRRMVGSMNLLMQPSYTETFNNVTADGVAEGVPSVVTEVIEWAPKSWHANCDEAENIADVGRRLLHDKGAPHDGHKALKQYVATGLTYWKKFLA